MIPYENCRVRGPNQADNFYFLMDIIWPDGKRQGVYYHRYLMEKHLGRYLGKDEDVHHIDGNNTNNAIENLQVLSHSEHTSLHMGSVEPESFICPWCKVTFILKGPALSTWKYGKRTQGYLSGPFCSRKCSANYRQPEKSRSFNCLNCLQLFHLSGRKLESWRSNSKNINYNGPFCCRSCSGVFAARRRRLLKLQGT